MKLLFIHNGPVFYDTSGNYYEYSYHGLLERYGYIANDISFLMRTMPYSKDANYDLVPKEINVIPVKNILTPIGYFKYKGNVRQIIENEVQKNDCLILRGGTYSNIAIKYAKKYRKHYIIECVGCTRDALWNHSLLGKILAPLFYYREKKAIKNAPYVYYVTNEFLQRRYPTKGKKVGCSDVYIDAMDEKVLESRLKKIDNFDIHKPISIGTAAAIDVRYKGQEYVINAVKMLKKEGINIKYYLAGGNKKNSTFLKKLVVKKHLENNIFFLGALNHTEMTNFYDSLDIYIQPSKLEGLPRSVIEAMSRGCPIVASNVGGIPELLDKECLFKKGSSKAIYESLMRVIHSDLSKYSKRNFEKSYEYTADKLDIKRKKFYDMFLTECMK